MHLKLLATLTNGMLTATPQVVAWPLPSACPGWLPRVPICVFWPSAVVWVLASRSSHCSSLSRAVAFLFLCCRTDTQHGLSFKHAAPWLDSLCEMIATVRLVPIHHIPQIQRSWWVLFLIFCGLGKQIIKMVLLSTIIMHRPPHPPWGPESFSCDSCCRGWRSWIFLRLLGFSGSSVYFLVLDKNLQWSCLCPRDRMKGQDLAQSACPHGPPPVSPTFPPTSSRTAGFPHPILHLIPNAVCSHFSALLHALFLPHSSRAELFVFRDMCLLTPSPCGNPSAPQCRVSHSLSSPQQPGPCSRAALPSSFP